MHMYLCIYVSMYLPSALDPTVSPFEEISRVLLDTIHSSIEIQRLPAISHQLLAGNVQRWSEGFQTTSQPEKYHLLVAHPCTPLDRLLAHGIPGAHLVY